MKVIKVAHFAIFAPHISGQYATVKDLILAERRVGLDAQFIDYGLNQKAECREGLMDGEITTTSLSWALDEADIIVRHSDVPSGVFDGKKRVLFALHGRPENSFRLEQYKIAPIISTIMKVAALNIYSGFFTFWPEFLYYWKSIISNTKVYCIPSPVNLDEFKIPGKKHDFGKHAGDPNIIIADRWREDNSPFNLVYAAKYFKENFSKNAKLHLYGIPTKNTCINYLAPLQKMGLIGQTCGLVSNLTEVYRSADVLLTPNIIATRIVRETMASGLPIVAPHGCRHTSYRAEPRDIKSFAEAIGRCLQDAGHELSLKLRKQAEKKFNLDNVGRAMKKLCDKVMSEPPKPRPKLKWNAMSITPDDWQMIKDAIELYNINSVVEFGSGVSTKLLSEMDVDVLSFETSMEQIESSSRATPNAVIRPWDGKSIPKIDGDMAFIDGPHGGKNREPSYRAVAESEIPLVFCHDNHRPEDRQWIDKYFKSWDVLEESKTLIALRRAVC